MIGLRQYRTKVFREQVEKEWTEKYWKFVKDNIDKPWQWDWLSLNPNITFDMVQSYPDKSWDWDYLSLNPNITFDIVHAHPDKPWNWYYLSRNTFSHAKKNFVEKRYNEYLSAYRIQQHWNRVISVPTNPICQRKIKRDYQKYAKGLGLN
jgi:hypothetical protein